MAGKYFTNEDIRKMMTEKVKGYLDQGWYFNFNYMRCSNGYEFAAVTDGNDTVVIYFQSDKMEKATCLNVEKFTNCNNEYQNIWLDQGRGEIIETTQFLYNYETGTYAIVNDYDEDERQEKHFKRRANREYSAKKTISEPMKEALAKYIKTKGIPGLKRFKANDITSASYRPRQNRYDLGIKGHRVYVHRDTWDVMIF